jgi:four helix bundle suffix protein
VARASLEELKLDYEDFLRQRELVRWEKDNPLRQALIDRRCGTADEVAGWVREVGRVYGLGDLGGRGGRGGHSGLSGLGGPSTQSTPSTTSTQSTRFYPEISANAVLVLIAVACSLLDRQVQRLAEDFENEGGFSERLYRVRNRKRTNQS